VLHRENNDLLAGHEQFRPFIESQVPGLDPLVISRVVVGKKGNDCDSQAESEYDSDHSYEFHVGKIDYTKDMLVRKLNANVKVIIRIQAFIRGALTRLRLRKKRQTSASNQQRMLLFIDITRAGRVYRVEVYR